MNIKFPDDVFTVNDDNDALAIIVENGILGSFPQYTGTVKANMSVVGHTGHKTHWIVAVRFVGNENPADNGYVVYGFPKIQHSSEYIRAFIADLYENHGDGSGYDAGGFFNPKSN